MYLKRFHESYHEILFLHGVYHPNMISASAQSHSMVSGIYLGYIRGYIGIMENKMEATLTGYIGYILGSIKIA